MSQTDSNILAKKKVLFLCHGYAVHAFRRISIFTEDESFDVTVVSNYDYKFNNAKNILLNASLYGKSHTDPTSEQNNTKPNKKTWFSTITTFISKIPFLFNFLLFIYDIYLVIMHLIILKRTVRKNQPDVIFLQTLLYPSYLSYFLPKGIPMIVTFWNGDIIWWAKWNGIERYFKKKIVSYGIRRAHAITVNSQSAYDICLDYNIDKQKVNLIRYPGIDLDIFKKLDKSHAKNELGIFSKKVVLCPRGYKREDDYLNNDIILEAAMRLSKSNQDLLFLFVGINENKEWQEFYNSTENKQFINNFRNDGSVPFDKMPIYYAAADVVVSISSNDSQPNCMLEAMACKTPIILGDIPQIKEWITDKENGFIVPCRSAYKLALTIDMVLKISTAELSPIIEKSYAVVGEKADQLKNIALIKSLVKNLDNQAK
ncbi:MAG: glycosyltransferase family 4 protein [Bacteroidales bacterium]|nr:glycosyltransferase family 4 protein [Bacteroidales bacterium]